ncbi:MAG: hypothetical protein A2W18_09320 [Candidatus Muproteobacteria bacterium RBG_16_60_9]|uniref:diguanylate cyclase n=1 Tax=Candidatus Muproteobacteria bacterium RBG_16_60_9 TaxID=1817755 RepID=A0A1F6V4W8_9PROT|nr:MAG: hypothetical protein A2W18_09320 [Candidatus Muproteobacteria bacterium RBG_16_60_9]
MEAEVSLDDHTPRILQSTPVDGATNVCEALVNYVKRTGKSVVVRDARHAKTALHGVDLDPYMRRRDVKSMLCIPLIIESAPESERLIGLLYLENKQAANTFDEQRFETLGIICLAATGRLELSRKAMTDGLTGLYNHDAFQNLLQKEFSAAQRAQQRLSVIMIDIDNFKAFNDQWGHPLGDAVLAKVAAVMRNACRQSDVVARYGGEEMAVILPNTDSASARIVAERIREYVETGGIEQNGSLLSVTVSVGVATSSSETRGPMSLVKLADQALYESKHAGRNRVSVK